MVKVRLVADELFALSESLKDVTDDVFLFGSRTDLSKRGGDIDVLVMAHNPKDILNLKLKIMTKFQWNCDQKIDVVVFPKYDLTSEQKDFLSIINMVSIGQIL